MINRLLFCVPTLLLAKAAYAGFPVKIEGAPSPEEACWQYEEKANRMSHGKGECYVSCKIANVERTGENKFNYKDNAPKYQSSCSASKYDRKRIGNEQFLCKYPHPRTGFPKLCELGAPKPATPKPTAAEIRRAAMQVTYRSPRENYLEVTIKNTSSVRTMTTIQVMARDAGYTQPVREIAVEDVVVEPNSQIVREFHSWRGTDWGVNQL